MKTSIRCPVCDRPANRWTIKGVAEIDYGVFNITADCPQCRNQFVARQDLKTSKTSDGYILIRVSRLEPFFSQQMVPEQKYIWEQVYGTLPQGWVIHHINGVKTDNRLENLVAMPKASHNGQLQRWASKRFEVFCPFCHKAFQAWMPKKDTNKKIGKSNQIHLPLNQ